MLGTKPIIPSERAMAQSPSLKRLSNDFIVWAEHYLHYSPLTVRNYDTTLDQFRVFLRMRSGLEDLTLALFTDEAVQAFALDLGARGIHPNTILGKLANLSSFAQYLMQRKDARNKPLLTANPTKTFRWPTMEDPDTQFLHPEELRAFLKVELAQSEDAARALLFDTGVRASEACRADVGDLVEIDGGWSLAVTVKGRGTRRRKVHMPLSVPVAALLRGTLTDRGLPTANPAEDAAQPLLVNRQGKRFARQDLYELVRRIGEAAEITRFIVGPHTLRHTVNVVRAQGGLDDYTRSRMNGQSDPRSQARYRHITQGMLRAAKDAQADGLAAYLGTSGADK